MITIRLLVLTLHIIAVYGQSLHNAVLADGHDPISRPDSRFYSPEAVSESHETADFSLRANALLLVSQ